MIVPRTCTEISAKNEDQHREKEPQSLEAFRDVSAYVLLGDPGAGKTTAFKTECKELREKACLITARDFLTFDPQSHPEWRDKTLFIDGLDETRVGANDARTPFDQIRGRLDTLGKPRFRLSCREADWLGANDRRRLESVSPDSKVTVLRLNPLTDSDIADILNDRPDIGDAQAFIAAAEGRRVYELLKNPQTLNMLADVVAQSGGWPKSRKETFEMACDQMVREPNEEHQAAQESNTPSAPAQLLDAAGRLCAVQLISGVAGYTLHGQEDEDYPAPDQCDYDRREMLRSALVTRLFKGAPNNRTLVHRHIAEFLGARHLAQIIGTRLPARRVIALIEGKDGTVVTEMRGLSAWLAAHCEDARADLIARDPIGVGLYGDIREFSTGNKRALLKALYREISRLGSVEMAAAFGALATPDMEHELREVLTDSSRKNEHQMFTGFVLRFLREDAPMPGLLEPLLGIVRGDTWSPGINILALEAFIHFQDNENKTSELKALLADIQNGSVSDPDDELLGTLLVHLYPQYLPPSEVWGYQSNSRNREPFFGPYLLFWRTVLLKKSSNAQVAELLDSLNEWLSGLLPALESSHRLEHFPIIPIKLLARGLEAHGDELDMVRLYNWLDAGLAGNHGDAEAIREIRDWLEQRPNVQKAVILEGLARTPESDEFRLYMNASNVRKCLYDASPPSDFGLWFLKQAIAMEDTKPQIAELLFEWAVRAHTDQIGNDGLSLEILREHAQSNKTWKAYLDRLLTPHPWGLALQTEERRSIEAQRRQEDYWLDQIRPNETTLRENRAEPALLYKMADKYFGRFYRFSGDNGPKAIAELLRDDHKLVDATLQGLRGAIDREDVPDVEEILRLKEKGRMHYLGWPFLAGLAEVERTAPEDSSRWDDRRIRTALAFYYSTPHADYRPKWYRRLLVARPEIVAEVQVQFVISGFRGDSEYSYKLFELAYDPDHAKVARHASLPLLRAFPTRCKLKQIENLDYLLWAALQYANRTSLQELIDRKLFPKRKSMNVAQRVHWLAAGLIVSPRAYNDLLRDFVQGHERRGLHLAKFFFSDDQVRPSLPELRVEILELLIRLVGSYIGPDKWHEEGLDTPAKQASRFVNGLIQRLAASPTKDASQALAALLADPALSAWSDVLSRARDAQQVTWRDANYRHFTIEQVCQTLNDGTPTNAADLAALLMDRFDEIADRIRTNNANYWRPYWNEDKNQNPTTPKHENSCRDALLRDLRLYFTNAEPEVQNIGNTRTDICVAYPSFQVPVEIKKNSHQELWSSMRNQLIAKYTIDPNTDGYGIYLVFWFGKDLTPPPPSGTRPTNTEELKKRLKATLSPDEARKISVCVIDVSRPD